MECLRLYQLCDNSEWNVEFSIFEKRKDMENLVIFDTWQEVAYAVAGIVVSVYLIIRKKKNK